MDRDPETYQFQKERLPTIPQLLVAFGILVLLFGSSYLPNLVKEDQATPQDVQTDEPAEEVLVLKEDAFSSITTSAQAVYVWDVAKQRALYKKNPDAQLPLASLTKLMTALVTQEVLEDDAPVTITLEAIQQEGESGFIDGDTWRADALLDYTLMTSSNDGAFALAAAAGGVLTDQYSPEESFVAAMNIRAEELGLSQTYFTNPTGLDESEYQSGSYGSARDMVFLMEYILTHHPNILTSTAESGSTIQNQQGAIFTATNTNQSVSDIPGILGSKTGYTVLAGGNLVVAFNAGLNRPVIVSVLGSTREGRFEDVLGLVEAAQNAIVNN